MEIRLKGYQQEFVGRLNKAWESVRVALGVLATGGGKCLGRGTPVMMYDGTIKPVELVQKGDRLMGPDSKPRTVLSTCRGREMLYRVTPVKGDPYVVNESHILSLRKTGTDEIVNIGVKDYLARGNNFKHLHKGWRAAIDWPVRYAAGFPIAPYMLGVWLGDGTTTQPAITTADPEVAEYVKGYAKCYDLVLREQEQPGNASKVYHLTNNFKRQGSFKSALRDVGVLGDKHIPLSYKTASRAQRLELLAGVVDSDGYLHHGGYDLVLKSEKLIRDVAFLARSLGFACYPKPCQKTCTNTGTVGTYWRMAITGDVSLIPTRLARHQPAPRQQKKNVLNTGITVEPIGEGDYFGFEINGDHLFLLGDFTVTHNTFCFSYIIRDHHGAAACIVHRNEIVQQISLSLAKLGVTHRLVADEKKARKIRKAHLEQFGRSFIDPNALVGVCSVQTLNSRSSARKEALQRWVRQCTLAVFDEGHHYVQSGDWARAVQMFDHAKLLLVTATPERADGIGLGVPELGGGGFVEQMVEGPQCGELIKSGDLCRFRYVCPESDLNFEDVAVGKNGDFNARALRARVVESHLVSDVVEEYLRWCPGKRTIVFATDIETAEEMAAKFRASGVKALALSSKNSDEERDKANRDFASGALQVLVNVDLFDEGYDVPACEVAILARPTESLAKFLQQVGRVLRTAEGKECALVIDLVRNIERHGAPNWPRVWSLRSREKKSRTQSDVPPARVCNGCTQPYEAYHKQCPYCGTPPTKRCPNRKCREHVPLSETQCPYCGEKFNVLKRVDGDLTELDVEALAALFAQQERVEMSREEFRADMIVRRVPQVGQAAQLRHHEKGKYRRKVLKELMAWWVGMQPGREMQEIYKRFYFRFGMDMATALTLPHDETDKLINKMTEGFCDDLPR